MLDPLASSRLALPLALLLVAGGCGKKQPQAPPAATTPAPAATIPGPAATSQAPADTATPPADVAPAPKGGATATKIDRMLFNRTAAELTLPLFWRGDDDDDGALDPDELAVLVGMPTSTPRERWVSDGDFAERARAALERVAAVARGGFPKRPAADQARFDLVRAELAAGRPTLVETDLRERSDADRAFVTAMSKVGALIEKLYHRQTGSLALIDRIPKDDTPSRALFHRNHGPWCVAPKTENEPACNAIAGDEPVRHMISGMYPAKMQGDPSAPSPPPFCEELAAREDAKELMSPFNVVVEGEDGALGAVPYHVYWKDDMEAVAQALEAAISHLDPAIEGPLVTYLTAAAKAFRDGSWESADEAWASMNAHNSRWYVRVGPDEVYFEPCSRKAGFHLSFALINQDSLRWQRRLDPLKADMESALAALAGPPYQAREVDFHLPDFIDIVLNAGDDRSPHGATIGQSLPNWGPVANEGRGRTVAMTNLYTDADSRASFQKQARSVLCKDAVATVTWDQEPGIMSTVLHEAAHNLGPAHEYEVNGETAPQIFGGPLASTFEELKAQTAALWLATWLHDKKVIGDALYTSAFGRDVLWAFGHISNGMVTSAGDPKPYAQLSAIQVGWLMDHGALVWHPDERASDGEEVGCMAFDLDQHAEAVLELMDQVAGIKARGDKAAAEALRDRYVDVSGDALAIRETITARWLRVPKATFVYSFRE